MKIDLKPVSVIKVNLGIQNGGPVHAYFTEQCYRYMDKYVPYSGNTQKDHLRENVTIDVDSITYEMPYAHAQYVGIVHGSPVVNYTTEGTGPYWDQEMMTAEGNELTKEIQKYVDTYGGKR